MARHPRTRRVSAAAESALAALSVLPEDLQDAWLAFLEAMVEEFGFGSAGAGASIDDVEAWALRWCATHPLGSRLSAGMRAACTEHRAALAEALSVVKVN